jgi:hypothetical protein
MMKRAMRCHDFGTGREALHSQYREYWQGERQCHGPKFVPARRVAIKIGGAPQRGAGIGATRSRDPLVGCDRGADRERVVSKPIPCASAGSDPQRGPSSALRRAPFSGMRPRRRVLGSCVMARICPAPGSHPSIERLEPAPPCTGHFVDRLGHAPRTRSRAAWCVQGRRAACGCDNVTGLMLLLPQTGPRLTSRSRRDMLCAALRVITNFDSQRTRVS